jgi:Ca2+-transporting ATPase
MESGSYYNKSVEDTLKSLNTSDKGLTKQEAEARLRAKGKNILPKKKPSLWSRYFANIFNPMVVILMIAAIIQFFLGENFSSIAIFSIITLNAIIALYQQHQAEKTLEALQRISSFKAVVIRDGEPMEIEADQVVVGDILKLNQGDYVSADARLISCVDMEVNESALTGESVPSSKSIAVIPGDNVRINDQTNMVFMSTFVTKGNGKAVVTGTGLDTEIGKVAKTIETMESREIPLQKAMGGLSKRLGAMVILICFGLFFYQLGVNASRGIENTPDVLADQISWLVSLAVAAIPFNFPLITTIILLTGVIALAKKNAIIKKLTVVETLGRLSVICSDKTGTLTKNEMTVQKLFFNMKDYKISGTGYDANGEIFDDKNNKVKLTEKEFELMIHSGVENNNTQLIDEVIELKSKKMTKRKVIGLPTEAAILVLAEKCGYDVEKIRADYVDLKEHLFNSERKRMSKFVKSKDGQIYLFVKGAPEALITVCKSVYANNKIIPMDNSIIQTLNKKIESYASDGLRTLAITYRPASESEISLEAEHVEKDLILLGIVGILDPPREGVKEAIESCKSAHIKVVMITGDHATTAKSIAHSLGIWKPGDSVIEGNQISQMSGEEIEKTSVFARVAPDDKKYIVDKFQSNNKVVAMTGDGINDAIALERADAGIAMGIAGTDVAKNAAAIILTDDSFATIERAVYHGRGIFNNIRSNIAFLLSVNIMELFVLTIAALFLQQRIFLGNQLLIFYITIHFFPPLALMFDKYDRNIMTYPPKPHNAPLIDRKFLYLILTQIFVIGGFLLIEFSIYLNGLIPLNDANLIGFGTIDGEDFFINDKWYSIEEFIASGEIYAIKARTMCALSLFTAELIVAWESRSDRLSILKMPINIILLIITGLLIFIMVIVFTLPLSHMFLVLSGLSTSDILIAILFGLPILVVMEGYKLWLNKKSR